MRFAAFLSLVVFLCLGCLTVPAKYPPHVSMHELAEETVVLEASDGRCTAVWIDERHLLTAAHCSDELGIFTYSLQGEKKCTDDCHLAVLVKEDKLHDLALVVAMGELPLHGIAVVGIEDPQVGDDIHLMGHPAGQFFTYTHGYVAKYRQEDLAKDHLGPYLQLNAPVYYGNSGGGVFNNSGQLVGVMSMMHPQAPSMGWAVPRLTIQKFLTS